VFAHVTTRGNARQQIFFDDADYRLFIAIVRNVAADFEWLLHTYCVMPNHYHLVVESPLPLPRAMHLINGRYARRFNLRYGRTGHVWEGPYDATPVESDEHFTEACRYIADNPVRAGLCATGADWPWSGGDTYDCHKNND
jgi:REP-associated tyrosine transposase